MEGFALLGDASMHGLIGEASNGVKSVAKFTREDSLIKKLVDLTEEGWTI